MNMNNEENDALYNAQDNQAYNSQENELLGYDADEYGSNQQNSFQVL